MLTDPAILQQLSRSLHIVCNDLIRLFNMQSAISFVCTNCPTDRRSRSNNRPFPEHPGQHLRLV